ncbi:MAG: rod shape-determining protein MreC [Deltaproteobacteria bacterium]|nr:rod shape-determining protein MreC [Deltaproteobacteria bacterium]
MKGFYKRLQIYLFIILLFSISLFLLLSNDRTKLDNNPFSSAILELAAPVQNLTAKTFNFFRSIVDNYLLLINIRKENLLLKKRLKELTYENQRLKEMKYTNIRLKKMLDFKQSISFPLLPANVIGMDSSPLGNSIFINKGTAQGVKVGMGVVAPEGVVGYVIRTSRNFSSVIFLTDRSSGVNGLVQRSRAKGVVKGTIAGNYCEVKYLLKEVDVRKGDLMVTSGIGGKFPKGVVIGRVDKIENRPDTLFKMALLTPAVDFYKLEEVFVVLSSMRPDNNTKR